MRRIELPALLLMVLNAAVCAAAGQNPSDTVALSDPQLGSISVARVAEREFFVEKHAVGNVDFDENMSVQVFSPYQGRIISARADLGDDVRKDQILFTVESPDFIAARSRNAIGPLI